MAISSESIDVTVYDVSVVDGILTAYSYVQFDGAYTDPDEIRFRIYTIPQNNRSSFQGDLFGGKVVKIADGIFKYTEDVSQLVKGKYDISCEVIFSEP